MRPLMLVAGVAVGLTLAVLPMAVARAEVSSDHPPATVKLTINVTPNSAPTKVMGVTADDVRLALAQPEAVYASTPPKAEKKGADEKAKAQAEQAKRASEEKAKAAEQAKRAADEKGNAD